MAGCNPEKCILKFWNSLQSNSCHIHHKKNWLVRKAQGIMNSLAKRHRIFDRTHLTNVEGIHRPGPIDALVNLRLGGWGVVVAESHTHRALPLPPLLQSISVSLLLPRWAQRVAVKSLCASQAQGSGGAAIMVPVEEQGQRNWGAQHQLSLGRHSHTNRCNNRAQTFTLRLRPSCLVYSSSSSLWLWALNCQRLITTKNPRTCMIWFGY